MPRSYFEIKFTVFEKEGLIVGFGLVAEPHTESEIFCASFPKLLLVKKTAKIEVKGEQIIFINPEWGICTFIVPTDVATRIGELLSDDNDIVLEIQRHGFMTPGFKFLQEGVRAPFERSVKRALHCLSPK